MKVRINNTVLLFSAIESMTYDGFADCGSVTFRTVSGKEYVKTTPSRDAAEKMVNNILDLIAMCESV